MKVTWEEMAEIFQKSRATPLLNGAIDLHYHAYPEINFDVISRVEDAEAMKRARDGGMHGIVLKNHLWPTTSHVYHLRKLVPDINIFSSITLNISVGGPSVWIVDAAARLGAKVVWMPTWSSANNVARGGFSAFMKVWFPLLATKLGDGLTLVDSSGQLLTDVRDIIRLSKEQGLVLSTGHISPAESLAMAAAAERIGFEKLIFCHPTALSVGATFEEIKEMSKRGAYIELDAQHGVGHGHTDKMLEIIDKLGPEHCILSTDSFGDWHPPAPEFLRTFIGMLMMNGAIGEKAIRTMVSENPGKLLDLPTLENKSIANK